MFFLRRLFSKRKKKKHEDVVAFARSIEIQIDQISLEIFRIYKTTLLKEPNIYIVPAVWGATKEGELTEVQKEIHERVAPVIEEILSLLNQEALDVEQKFAVGYIVRGFFISKIIYMVEFYRNMSSENQPSMDNQVLDLKDMEPMGRA